MFELWVFFEYLLCGESVGYKFNDEVDRQCCVPFVLQLAGEGRET